MVAGGDTDAGSEALQAHGAKMSQQLGWFSKIGQAISSYKAFRARYAREDGPGGNPFEHGGLDDATDWEWRRKLLLPHKEQSVILLCCPEDVQISKTCRHELHEMCAECWVPFYNTCESAICQNEPAMTPMTLCNDNYWGYTSELIYRYQVRWIEAAIVSPCWTTMLVFYAEGDFGHLINEEVGKTKYRTAVRGSCCSFHMPWEEILHELNSKIESHDLAELPRPQECLKYLWRAHLKVAGVDFKKQLKQIHVRPFVLVRLLHFLIDQGHEVSEDLVSQLGNADE